MERSLISTFKRGDGDHQQGVGLLAALRLNEKKRRDGIIRFLRRSTLETIRFNRWVYVYRQIGYGLDGTHDVNTLREAGAISWQRARCGLIVDR